MSWGPSSIFLTEILPSQTFVFYKNAVFVFKSQSLMLVPDLFFLDLCLLILKGSHNHTIVLYLTLPKLGFNGNSKVSN